MHFYWLWHAMTLHLSPVLSITAGHSYFEFAFVYSNIIKQMSLKYCLVVNTESHKFSYILHNNIGPGRLKEESLTIIFYIQHNIVAAFLNKVINVDCSKYENAFLPRSELWRHENYLCKMFTEVPESLPMKLICCIDHILSLIQVNLNNLHPTLHLPGK